MQDQHVAVMARAFRDHVHAGDAEIDAAIAHADHDVRWALEQHGQAGQGRDDGLVLARVGPVNRQPAGCQEGQAVFRQAPFGG